MLATTETLKRILEKYQMYEIIPVIIPNIGSVYYWVSWGFLVFIYLLYLMQVLTLKLTLVWCAAQNRLWQSIYTRMLTVVCSYQNSISPMRSDAWHDHIPWNHVYSSTIILYTLVSVYKKLCTQHTCNVVNFVVRFQELFKMPNQNSQINIRNINCNFSQMKQSCFFPT